MNGRFPNPTAQKLSGSNPPQLSRWRPPQQPRFGNDFPRQVRGLSADCLLLASLADRPTFSIPTSLPLFRLDCSGHENNRFRSMVCQVRQYFTQVQ